MNPLGETVISPCHSCIKLLAAVLATPPLFRVRRRSWEARKFFFLVGQYLGGSGTHLSLIHIWLNVLNSLSTYGLLLHSDFITLPAKLWGLRDDITIKGWRVLMPWLPWKLLVSSSTCLHYFQLRSQLHIERVQARQKNLHHFSSTSCKENGRTWASREKGYPLQIIWRWCLQGTRVQTEGLFWHQKISKKVNYLLPFLLKRSMRKA